MTRKPSVSRAESATGKLGTLLCKSGVAEDGVVDCNTCQVEVYVVLLLDELVGNVGNIVLCQIS